MPLPRGRSIALPTILVLAAVALPALPVTAQVHSFTSLQVTAVDPHEGRTEDPVVISGTGFGQDPGALFCWVDAGTAGFPFEVTAATDSSLDAVVGATPSAATGAVKVWRGKGYPLRDRVLQSQGRLFAATSGEVFVRGAAAVGPDFSALVGSTDSPWTSGSVALRGALRVDVDPGGDPDPPPPQRVRVTAVIETSDEESSGNEGLVAPPANVLVVRTAKAGPAWAATLTIEADARPSTHEALAAGLAEMLEAQLGSLGLTAHAEGTES